MVREESARKSNAERQKRYRDRHYNGENNAKVTPPSSSSSSSATAKDKEVSPNGDMSSKVSEDACPHKKIIEAYHEALPQCPKVKSWTEANRKNLRTRWREDKQRQSLEWWRKYFAKVAESDFLTGRVQSDRPFVADLEWLVRPTNMGKVLNGRYDNRKPQQQKRVRSY
jgi:hypothetical protein